MGYLSRYVLTLDFPRQKAYFKKGNGFGRVDRLDQSGMQLLRRGKQLVVDQISPNSPAWESGILVGDVIRRVNGTAVSTYTFLQLRRLLEEEGQIVAINAQRGAELLEFKLTLRNYRDVHAESKRRLAPHAATRARQPATAVVCEFDVARNGAPLIVPVAVAGFERPLRMLLDSGSAMTIFDTRLRASLGEGVGREQLNTPTGPSWGERCRVSGITLGGVRLGDETVVIACDVKFIASYLGFDDLDGVLGMDALHGQIVQIDFDAGKVRLLESIGADIGVRNDIVYRHSGVPALAVTLGDLDRRWFAIDTGCINSNFCEDELFSTLAVRNQIHDIRPSYLLDASGTTAASNRGRANRIKIGPFGHQNVQFTTAKINALGLQYLSRYAVTLDFPGRAVYLKKGERYDRVDRYDMSGLVVVRRDQEYVVAGVVPGSPAKDAGIVAGDVIRSVGGLDAANYSMFQLREFLSDAGKTVVVALRRQTKDFEAQISLRHYSRDPSSERQGPLPELPLTRQARGQ